MGDASPTNRLADGEALRDVVSLRNIPVFCNALQPTAAEARSAPTGDLDLVFNPQNGYLFNRSFDAALTEYSPVYDNALHFSPRFQDFATELVDRLINRYGISGDKVIEIGCGSANFLAQLCDAADCTGIGYDPSFDPGRTPVASSDRITVIPEYYPTDREVDGKLVICQHVLEHVPDPLGLLEGVRASMGERDDVAVYFEVPDATYMIEELAVWDLIYEHASYFSAPTMANAFERAGFDVVEADRAFGNQYLWLEARPASAPRDEVDQAAVAKLGELVDRFDEHVTGLITDWTSRLADMVNDGPTAIWGAGSKGVTFLNLIPAGAEVSHVVDINPNKAGLHIPGTAQAVVGPEQLPANLAHVVVMNPLYEDEIRQSVRDLGTTAHVTSM